VVPGMRDTCSRRVLQKDKHASHKNGLVVLTVTSKAVEILDVQIQVLWVRQDLLNERKVKPTGYGPRPPCPFTECFSCSSFDASLQPSLNPRSELTPSSSSASSDQALMADRKGIMQTCARTCLSASNSARWRPSMAASLSWLAAASWLMLESSSSCKAWSPLANSPNCIF
jgi:hypothetical protein